MNNFNLITRFLFINLLFLISVVSVNAQVGIGTTTPQATLDIVGDPTDSAVLDGVIPPRLTGDQLSDKTYAAAQTAAVVYVTAADGTPSGQTINVTDAGYYYFNGSVWVIIAPNEDDDFYEVGTTVAAQDITDDVFRTGKVAIGKTSASSALDITDNTSTNAVNFDTTGSDNVLNLRRSGSKSGTARGLYVDYVNSDSGSGIQQGIATYIRGGAGTGTRYGVYNNIQSASGGTNQIIGTYNELNSGNGTGAHTGIYNRLAGNTDRTKTGVSTYLTGTDDGTHYGINNNIASSGSGIHTGIQNQMRGTGYVRGVYNTMGNNAGDGRNRGMENQITNNGDGEHQGVYTSLSGSGSGDHSGASNYITSTGNGVKNGVANTISVGTGTGIHRGTYNNISGEGTIYGVENDIDGTQTGQTAYGTYNDVNSNNGTNIGGYFNAHGSGGTYYAAIFDQGNVGIGNSSPAYKLDVTGDINLTGTLRNSGGAYSYPDYVFETYFDGFSEFISDYSLKSLKEIETFLKSNKHLPNIQSRSDVFENGWDLTEGIKDNLEKVEELFLHAIEANKKIEKLEAEKESISNQLEKTLHAIEQLNNRIDKLEEN